MVRPSVNIKLFSVGGRIYQNIKQKENQRGPLGDHLKDDPASGDKANYNSSKAFGETSTGIVWCFWGDL